MQKQSKCTNGTTNWRNRRKEQEVYRLTSVGVSDSSAQQIGLDRPGKGKHPVRRGGIDSIEGTQHWASHTGAGLHV